MKNTFALVFLLFLGCIWLQGDVFGPEAVVQSELKRGVFVVNPDKRNYVDAGEGVNPWDYTKECIDLLELDLIRFLQSEGVDFMGVKGSFLMVPGSFRKSLEFVYPYRYKIIIINTEDNLDRAEGVLMQFNAVRLERKQKI